ncbi:peptidase domain-containing ABC transporter [Alistipes sp. ZOR0009]|uniref:peptidase domain-containing ABC transporter n=1 Tax=Alistipes sp. ZOR0009 TaxID=1339253 RepID=UPI0006491997|nr:peptidase domain-containing ABC transporter [Alistipes sp. ZOR0009]
MKIFPNYQQLDSMDCGPTCLRIIAKYYGRSLSMKLLRDKCFMTREGVSMLGLCEAAESIGFHTNGVKITFDQLFNEKIFPCILHWNQNHFVVCYKIKKKHKEIYEIKISDPLGERYSLSKSEFLKCWANSKFEGKDIGIVLFLKPTPEFYKENDISGKNEATFIYYLRYLRPYRSQLIQITVGLIIGSILSFILPFLTQSIVDQGISNGDLGFISLVLISQLFLFATQLIIEFIRNWITLHINSRISISLISDFLNKLMKLPISFFNTKNIGDIMQRIEDNSRIKSFLTGSSLSVLFSFANFIIFATILSYYSIIILGVFFTGNALYIIWVILFMHYRRKLDAVRFSQASAEQDNLVQLISGMQEIKLNNCEKQQRWKWEGIQINLFNISIKGLALEQYQQIGSIFFSQTAYIIISFISARKVVEGTLTLGMMMSISYIIGQLSGPIGQLISFIQSAQDAKLSLERLREIHNKEDEEQKIEYKTNNIPPSKDISIDNLFFSYDNSDRNYVLKGINLVIPENKVTAIVGTSGSGKTTLIKLLLAIYFPSKGKIKIDNVSLSDLNPHLWRLKSGAVMQDGFIFSDTIANNIALGQDIIDKEKLLHSVEVANIKEFIESLPLKYNTKIGMSGNGISQGQRQRLLIARAVYKNPDFLFFDEATNSLDAKNEKCILDNLNLFYKGKTVVIVAHRLSTVQNADKIIVMDNGLIIEEGTHNQLINNRSTYYYLVHNQLQLGK